MRQDRAADNNTNIEVATGRRQEVIKARMKMLSRARAR